MKLFTKLGLGLLCFSVVAKAQVTDCDKVESEFKSAQGNLSDTDRLLQIQSIHNHTLALRQMPDHHLAKPKSFWQNCLDSKIRALNMHYSLASPKLKSMADFHILLSSSFEMRGELGRAYFHALQASNILPKDYGLRMRTLSLWLKSQSTLLDLERSQASRGKGNKPLALGDKKDFDQKMEFFLMPILKDRNAKPQDLVEAYHVRASYYESLARIVDAAGDWEKLTELDPRNVVPHKKLAAFELSRGRKTEARVILEKVLRILPSDLGAQKKLIELYLDKREMERAKGMLSQALAFYPDDSDLMAFRKAIN